MKSNIPKILFVLFLLNSIFIDCYAECQSAVVTEQHLASRIGGDILQQGGNAIDAAVAVGYALAVVNPCCGNIGGGGLVTLHLANGKNIFLNFRERAPLKATPSLFFKKPADASLKGFLAVATPGTVLGLETLRKCYGTLPLSTLIQPAIKLAENGFILQKGDVQLLKESELLLKNQSNVRAIFFKNQRSFGEGDRLKQLDLANSLKLISKKGPDVFYKGSIAKTIVNESHRYGGILALNDFSHYFVKFSEPVYCYYRGYKIVSAPMPSSGGFVLCHILNSLERVPLRQLGFHTKDSTLPILSAMSKAFKARNKLLMPNPEGLQTTHYSIVDKKGNAIAVTYTLNSFFGAGVIAGHTGFLLNNEMDDFTTRPGLPNQFGLIQGKYNLIEPGKRPLSSMTPTIIMKNNRVVMVLGSPGGPRIITSVLETILNVLDYQMTIEEAVNAPRFHYQAIPNRVDVEEGAFTEKTMKALRSCGYQFTLRKPWGAVEAIFIDPMTHQITAANDKRRPAGSVELSRGLPRDDGS